MSLQDQEELKNPERLMQVREYMTTRLVTVEMDDTLDMVREIFDNTGFHHLLVVERGAVVGVLSDRDLLRHLSPYVGTLSETARDVATLQKPAHLVMTRKPLTVSPESGLAEVLEKFSQKDVTCLPVVDDHNRLVGIVTWHDMLQVMRAMLGPASGVESDPAAGDSGHADA